MHKVLKLGALAGAVWIVMVGSAIAANHDLVFDGWTVTNGKINETVTLLFTATLWNTQSLLFENLLLKVSVSIGSPSVLSTFK